jgi:hypothetical protein
LRPRSGSRLAGPGVVWLGLAALTFGCAAPAPTLRGAPMAGSASVSPSPARAERVPSDVAPATSSSAAPAAAVPSSAAAATTY